jgi:DNA-3-methyladenine glycosylase I
VDIERCTWAGGLPEDYLAYHDLEWGRPVADDTRVYEKLSLEGFQSGLSWLTILRRREGFRAAFGGFDPVKVAAFGPSEVERLLRDPGIIRHRGKIEACINNARAVLGLWESGQSLAGLVWEHRPALDRRPVDSGDVVPSTPESVALARQLRSNGFRFIGPTTAYAAMQALGVVNDHLVRCFVRDQVDAERDLLVATLVAARP